MEGCTMRKPPVSRRAALAAGSARGMGTAGGAAAVRGIGAAYNVAAADGADVACSAERPGSVGTACDTDAAGLTGAGNGGRRRIDPRVSLAVLLLLNATAFAPKLVGVQVLMVALLAGACAWCGRARAAFRWCVAYAAIMAVAGLLMLTPQTVSASFATMAVLARCIFCVGMFASNMIATTRVGEMA